MQLDQIIENASPEEFLEYLQRSCGQGFSPFRNINPNDKFFKKAEEIIGKGEIEEHIRFFKTIKLPTKLQDNIYFFLINELTKGVLQSLSDFNLNLNEKVVFGTLPTGEVNAVAIKVPSGGHIVALNHGLFLFIYLMSKVVTSFIPVTEDNNLLKFKLGNEDLIKAIEDNHIGNLRFIDVLFSHIELGNVYLAEQYFPQKEQIPLAYIINQTAQMFVVAHEYAHVVLKHNEMDVTFMKRLVGQIEVEEIIKNWNCEYEADELGCELAMAHNLQREKLDLPLSFLGIDFFFTCMELVQEITGTKSSYSHPSSALRKEALRTSLLQFFPQAGEKAIELGNILEFVLMKLWEKNKAKYENKLLSLKNNLDNQ